MSIKIKIIAGLLACLAVSNLPAQDYEPTTTWPYVYQDFTPGGLQQVEGKSRQGQYNICLAGNTLHFIDGPFIKEILPSEVFSVRIGQDYYANVSGRMMKVLAKSDKGFVAIESVIDIATLNATGGAYGSSSNSVSTQALSSFEGIGGSRSNMNHMELKNSKDEGKVLPLVEKVWLVVPGKVVFAAKKDVLSAMEGRKNETAAFIKEKKIKWKDPESLLLLVNFMAE